MSSKDTSRLAKVFWSGRSQAIRLPKQFRFTTDTVVVRKEGQALIVEASDEWPENYVASFTEGVAVDLKRPRQGDAPDEREDLP